MKTQGYSYLSLSDALCNAELGDRETCKYEAGILLEHFCGLRREQIPFRKNEIFTSSELLDAVEKRIGRYPLQYLIGEWPFFNEVYRVTPHCLIPRADTEVLVELAIDALPQNGRILDLCTGSGCIAISLLASRKDAYGTAVELYPTTLDVAKENAVLNRVSDRLDFLLADALLPSFMDSLGSFDLILSNPPYIPTLDVSGLSPEVRHEPHAALDGGADGLDFYRVLVSAYPKYLKPGGKMILEIGYDQGDSLHDLAKNAGLCCEICKDYGGNDRVAVITKN